MKVGILALQGDFTPHSEAVQRVGHCPELVRYPAQIESLDSLILPGGESTTIYKLLDRWGLIEPLYARARNGLPIWGTCAGSILLASRIRGASQPTLGLMDMEVERNAYGRQVDSFEASLCICGLPTPMRAVFIRAPLITQTGPGVRVLATHQGGIVAACQHHCLATTFHPELTGDDRLLRWFLESHGTMTPWSGVDP